MAHERSDMANSGGGGYQSSLHKAEIDGEDVNSDVVEL